MTITYVAEIPYIDASGEEDYLQVDLKVTADYGNHGIGSYEYWGIKGNDVQMGWEIDDVEWDKQLFDEKTNELIGDYVADLPKHAIEDIYDKLED